VREVDVGQVTEAVARLATEACTYLGEDVVVFLG